MAIGPATVPVLPGQTVYVNLVAGSVTLNPSGFTAGTGSKVFLVDPNNDGYSGHTCSINPMAGGKISSASVPGSLTTSALVLAAPGEGGYLESPDATNLYFN